MGGRGRFGQDGLSMVDVTHDGTPKWWPAENCCVCRTPTRFWFTPRDVALCPPCAETATESSLPTKTEWFAAERAHAPRTFVNYDLINELATARPPAMS